ncbi:MAG: asparagine synthase (glutamine-hydrolyzing) [Bacteroidales bacterium]|nr:asparagine synthase (glutamine-hydrolyzing) [Bacteroidales bacterium]
MCGILAIFTNNTINPTSIENAIKSMLHRGKDNLSIKAYGNYIFAHCRLSVIDLSEKANQPIANENSNVILVCNGEIYNYKELKKELILKGHQFKSNSDNEVILHGYEEWGTNVLNKLIGMFAFVIYDNKTQTIFAARDRFGIKPLYYYHKNNTLIFASELKGIINLNIVENKLSIKSIISYLTYRYVPSPYTIYTDIYKLEPASFIIRENNKFKALKYWDLKYNPINISQTEFKELFYYELENSFKLHTLADVDFGLLLSSGYDSSFLAYLANKNNFKINTFTVGFNNWHNSEEIIAHKTAQIFNHISYSTIIKEIDYKVLEDILYYYDEPIADISIIPTYIISKLVTKYHKVVLSGDGADELLVGYSWTKQLYNTYLKKIWKIKPNIVSLLYSHKLAMGLFNKKELKKILIPSYHYYIDDPLYFYKKNLRKDLPLLKALQYLDLKTFCCELVLTKIDRASMANTVEVRVPFLNHKLFELIFSVPDNYYFNKNIQKKLLYNILKNYIPIETLQRPKIGFVGPDMLYSNISIYKHYLKDSHLVKDGILNANTLNSYLLNNDYWRLWKILILELWYRKWIL